MVLSRGLVLGVLVLLLAGTTGTGWWNLRAGDLMQREAAELTVTIRAAKDIASAPRDLVPDLRGLNLAGEAAVDERVAEIEGRASVYQALDALDAADLTFEERALRRPLRPALGDYYLAHSRTAARYLQDTGIAGIPADGFLHDVQRGHIENVRSVAGRLVASLEARNTGLHTDLAVARMVGKAAVASAVLLALLTGVLVMRRLRRG